MAGNINYKGVRGDIETSASIQVHAADLSGIQSCSIVGDGIINRPFGYFHCPDPLMAGRKTRRPAVRSEGIKAIHHGSGPIHTIYFPILQTGDEKLVVDAVVGDISQSRPGTERTVDGHGLLSRDHRENAYHPGHAVDPVDRSRRCKIGRSAADIAVAMVQRLICPVQPVRRRVHIALVVKGDAENVAEILCVPRRMMVHGCVPQRYARAATGIIGRHRGSEIDKAESVHVRSGQGRSRNVHTGSAATHGGDAPLQ